jgi:uncharacterized membrane protein
MQMRFGTLAVLVPTIILAGCEPGDGIDPGGKVFAGIPEEAEITLSGTEPFWGLEIEAAAQGLHRARFTVPEEPDGRALTLSRFAGNNGLGFSGELDGKPVQVAITPGECSDGMSDRRYPFTATVAWGDEALLGCAYTSDEPFEGPVTP